MLLLLCWSIGVVFLGVAVVNYCCVGAAAFVVAATVATFVVCCC